MPVGPGSLLMSRTQRQMRLPSVDSAPITRPAGSNMISNGPLPPVFPVGGKKRYQVGVESLALIAGPRLISMPTSLGSVSTGSPGIDLFWRRIRYVAVGAGGVV